MGKITFIHAADLHLDSPFKGLAKLPNEIFHKVKESTFAALDRIVTYAIEERVDFVTLCGDLFDGENRSMRAQSKVKKGIRKVE
ncbi:MAG: metallophosphoesterase [Bacillaceae bacterium]|nr:metallophosphoesterase [Bacillaceae bacterium]